MGMEELEKYPSSLTDSEGIVGVIAWSACDHEAHRRFVAVSKREDDARGKCETVCDEVPCKVGPLGNLSEEPASCLGKSTGTHRAKHAGWHHQQRATCEVRGVWLVLLWA